MAEPIITDDDRRTALLQEHEELVQLFIHEDSMAWQITLALLAMNGALFAAVYKDLFKYDSKPGSELYVLLTVGVILNAVGYLGRRRSELYRLSRLFRAYYVEDALAKAGAPIRTFTSAERTVFRKKMLIAPAESPGYASSEPQVSERSLKRREKWKSLNFGVVTLVLALVFAGCLIWLLIGRPLPGQ